MVLVEWLRNWCLPWTLRSMVKIYVVVVNYSCRIFVFSWCKTNVLGTKVSVFANLKVCFCLVVECDLHFLQLWRCCLGLWYNLWVIYGVWFYLLDSFLLDWRWQKSWVQLLDDGVSLKVNRTANLLFLILHF